MQLIFKDANGAGVLDYVAAWYIKAASYMQEVNKGDAKTKTAFVSTNSIAQGEQVGILWSELYSKYKMKIHFAHTTFKWGNEAKGNAAVHVVIIGFSTFDTSEKFIYDYDDIKGEPHETKAKNISPYLVEGRDSFITRRSKPICKVPQMIWGNKPVDGGHLIFTTDEKDRFLAKEPKAIKFFRKFMGGQEFIQAKDRWCLWLVDANPTELKSLPNVLARIKLVKETRLNSPDPGARKLSLTPTEFRDTENPKHFIAVPEVSSERRKYIPIGFLGEDVIASNKLQMIPDAELWHFGILTSEMHMTWVRYTCGRMKSDYSYSNSVVYNNFPWPEKPSQKQIENVEDAAQNVLHVRKKFPESSLADLYDPNTMPPALVKAHQALDKAVDLCYRPQPFTSESKRIEYLFELYDKYTAGLFVNPKAKQKR